MNLAMQLNQLGTTGINVSHLGLGGLFTSSLGGGVTETRKMLEMAKYHGINYIDTAPGYADSEAILGEAIRGMQNEFVICTKFGGRPQPFNPQSKDHLRLSFEESLKHLGRSHIDVLLIHEPDRPQQFPWWTNYSPLEGPVLDYLNELQQRGNLTAKGLAGTTTTEMNYLVKQQNFEVLLTAFNYNILLREANVDLIPEANKIGMGIIVGSIFGQGFLSSRYDQDLDAPAPWLSTVRRSQFQGLYKLVDKWEISLPELCLRWPLKDSRLSTILIGAKNVTQLEKSIEAYHKGPLPEELYLELDKLAAMLPYRPYEEPMILPFGKTYHGPGLTNLGAGIPVGKVSL
jgi:aryl-alcohol dehydrogenase-like predicted oxidoreductase